MGDIFSDSTDVSFLGFGDMPWSHLMIKGMGTENINNCLTSASYLTGIVFEIEKTVEKFALITKLSITNLAGRNTN